MIIMPVSKDVRSFQPKFIGNFTSNQFKFICTGLIAGGALTLLLQFILPLYMAAIPGMIVGAPIVACGFVKIYDIPLDVFVKENLLTYMFSPEIRPNETENIYKELGTQHMITYEYFNTEEENRKRKKLSPKKLKKQDEIRLNKWIKANPEFKPID